MTGGDGLGILSFNPLKTMNQSQQNAAIAALTVVGVAATSAVMESPSEIKNILLVPVVAVVVVAGVVIGQNLEK